MTAAFQNTNFAPKAMHTCVLTLLIQLSLPTSPVLASDKPIFALPLDCNNGPTCFLQNKVDMDLTKGRLDSSCEHATYDGHKGTDIRVLSFNELKRRVEIKAMAAGVVTGTRSHMRDRLVEDKRHRAAIRGKECGNGVAIDHGTIDGHHWKTQTCHLARNSVQVKIGQKIKQGDVIGVMGLSGFTSFPHVHTSIWKDNKVVDPFSGRLAGQGCSKTAGKPLLTSKALKALFKRDFPLLQMGFSSQAVSGSQIIKATVPAVEQSGPLVVYAQMKNLRMGDQLDITLKDPTGVLSRNLTKPLPRPQATYTVFTGRKSLKRDSKTFQGEVKLIRKGMVVFKRKISLAPN